MDCSASETGVGCLCQIPPERLTDLNTGIWASIRSTYLVRSDVRSSYVGIRIEKNDIISIIYIYIYIYIYKWMKNNTNRNISVAITF